MMLTHVGIHTLIAKGNIKNAHDSQVNASSLDVRLGHFIDIEAQDPRWRSCVDPVKKERPKLNRIASIDPACRRTGAGFALAPGYFALGETIEAFSMPSDMTGFFCLRSSLARAGLQHAVSVGLKPGWNGKLTLEFKNELQQHSILLSAGMAVGDIYFFLHTPVDEKHLYNGAYNETENKD